MRVEDLLGWASSIVLLVTLVHQVHEQWRSGTSSGISSWLFLGQLTASLGFSIYSVLLKNWVFVFTNALLALNAVVGQAIVLKHRRKPAAIKG